MSDKKIPNFTKIFDAEMEKGMYDFAKTQSTFMLTYLRDACDRVLKERSSSKGE